jgi:hypothetical protein
MLLAGRLERAVHRVVWGRLLRRLVLPAPLRAEAPPVLEEDLQGFRQPQAEVRPEAFAEQTSQALLNINLHYNKPLQRQAHTRAARHSELKPSEN